MANPTRDVRLKKKIAGVLTELFPETRADLVIYGDGMSVAAKVAEILTLMASKLDEAAVDARVQAIVGAAPEALDTLKELADALGNDPDFAATITNLLSGKVDKEDGKGLSANDFTDALLVKLTGLSNYTHPATHSASMIEQDSTHRFVTDAEKLVWDNSSRVLFGADPGDLTDADLLLEEIL